MACFIWFVYTMFINRRYSLINIDWKWVILTPGSGVYKRFDVIATTDSALFPPMLRISTNKSTTWWFLKSFPALLHSAYWNIDSFSFVKTLHVVKRPDFYFSLQNFMNSLYGVTRGVHLGILRGVAPPGSSNPDAISDQKMPFSTPVFRPGLVFT